MATITAGPPRFFMRPACPLCGSRTLLVRIFPDKPGYDQHTYECPRCAHEITEIVQFPEEGLSAI
jgi:DNA-directed RNA polymerase subunit RPC12/RpoP